MKKIFIVIVIALTIFTSCNSKKDLLPNATGKPGEIIVVVNKFLWDNNLSSIFKTYFMDDYPSLPQYEPTFKVYPVPTENFNDIFQQNRNIIRITLNSNQDSTTNRINRNIWAKPQLVIDIVSKNNDSLISFLKQKAYIIRNIILNEERKRLKDVYLKFREKKLIPVVQRYGIDLIIPKGYRLNIDTNNFVWISYETPYMSQGLFIYSIPYKDTSIFNIKNIINVRDSVLKSYIPGPLEGSYMTTEHEIPCIDHRFYYNNHFYYEVRGLWRIENDYMGGPFVLLATIKNNNVVITEGYVYAPKDDKKPLVWQLEAILYSMINNN